MSTKVAIITGASTGLGEYAAKKCTEDGIYTIIASRNEASVAAAVDRIKKETKRDNIIGMKLDLSDTSSIRAFAAEFLAKNLPLHILVNNAAIALPTKTLNKDGIEIGFATGHLGHFLLTHLLLDTLKASAPSRIVVVSSELHDTTASSDAPSIEDYNFSHTPFSFFGAYKNTKRANVLFTYALHRRLKGTGVIVNTLTPGYVPATGLARHMNGASPSSGEFAGSSTSDPAIKRGGMCIVNAALNPAITEGGKYFNSDNKVEESSSETRKVDNQEKLWDISEKLLGVKW